MLKKILAGAAVLLVVLSVLIVAGANVIQRKAPDFLRQAMSRALNKKVVIQGVSYRFPRSFDLQGFEVREREGAFVGDVSLYVDRMSLDLSPVNFSQKKLVIHSLAIEDAQIVVRKHHGKLYHVLSGVMEAPPAGPAAPGTADKKNPASGLPLEIRDIRLKDCHFKFADYDAGPSGFVMTFDKIDARIHDVSFPAGGRRTSYEASAELVQERDERPARAKLSGWTAFDTLDTDAKISVDGAHAPYFRPYYGLVTGSVLEDGYADAQARIWLRHQVLSVDAGFALSGLLFSSYENGEQLFGMKAAEVLSFLKDSSGKLRFQISVQWNMADRSVRLQEIVRRSIEKSLRQTFFGSVGNVLMNALQKAAEGAEGPGKKGGLEEQVKKIKDFFKY